MTKSNCTTHTSSAVASGGLTIKCPSCNGTIDIRDAVDTVVAQRIREVQAQVAKAEANLTKKEEAIQIDLTRREKRLMDLEADLKHQAEARVKAQEEQHQQERAVLERKIKEGEVARNSVLDSTKELLATAIEGQKKIFLPKIAALEGELHLAKVNADKQFANGQQEAMETSAKRLLSLQQLLEEVQQQALTQQKAYTEKVAGIQAQAKQEADLRVAQAQKEASLKGRREAEEHIRAEVAHEHAVAEREKDARIEQLCAKIEELKLKAEAATSNPKGMAAQDVLGDRLREEFIPLGDHVQPIKSGVKGSDFKLIIPSAGSRSILLESKWTQSFDGAWIGKAQLDMAASKADLAVVVSRTLPMGVDSITQVDDVWVCGPNVAIHLISALRQGLVKVEATRKALNLNEREMTALKDYLTSASFRTQVETLVAATTSLREGLSKERSQHEALWTKAEAAHHRLLRAVVKLWTDLDINCGGALEPSKAMKPYLTPEEAEPKANKSRRRAA